MRNSQAKVVLSAATRLIEETDQHSFRQFGRHRKIKNIVNVEWIPFKLENFLYWFLFHQTDFIEIAVASGKFTYGFN